MKNHKSIGLGSLSKPTDPDCDGDRKKEGFDKNTGTLANKVFLKACEAVGAEPTRRQASKWNKKRGVAYNDRG